MIFKVTKRPLGEVEVTLADESKDKLRKAAWFGYYGTCAAAFYYVFARPTKKNEDPDA